MLHDQTAYLNDIRDSCSRIIEYAKDQTFESFITDRMRFDAVVRNIQIIGEAAKKLSDEERSKYPDIPWRDIIDMRNIVTHDYANIDPREVWAVAVEDVPQLLEQLETGLKK